MKNSKFRGRFSWLDFSMTLITIALVFGAGYLLFNFKNSSTAASPKNPDKNNQMPSSVNETDSSFAGIKIVTEISNDESAPFAIQYPQSKHTNFNDKVKKYINRLKYEYLTEVSRNQKMSKKFSSELNISFETLEHPSGYSFVIVKNQFTGNKAGELDIQAFRLNPETGESLYISDLFNNEINQLENLSQIVQKKLSKDKTLKQDSLQDKIDIYTKPLWKNFQNFAMTDDSLIFYFNNMVNESANVPIVSIPLKEINPMLAESFKVVDKKQLAENHKAPLASDNENASSSEEETSGNQESKADQQEPQKKRVALTFDDGPDPNVTTRILQTLEKYDAKATFFMLGSRVEYYPDIAKSVQEAGHELGNHTWTHPDLTKAQDEKIHNEIAKTSAIIEDVTGQKPEVFRPPYGAFNDVVKSQTDMPMILWDVDTLDWKHKNPAQLLAYVKNHTQDGSIILMHDIHPATADGLDAVLSYLKDNGFTFVTISELNS